MEVAGLALGAAAIVMAFHGAMQTVLLIEDFADNNEGDARHWALRHHVQKTRLQVWGDQWKADDENLCTLGSRAPRVRTIITQILDEIRLLNQKADGLVQKHNVGTHGAGIRSRFRWVIKAKSDFRDVVLKFKELVDDLYGFTAQSDQVQLLTRAFLPQILAAIQSSNMLRSLSENPPDGDQTLALSAEIKLLQEQISQLDYGINPTPPKAEFKLVGDSKTMGLVTKEDGQIFPAWVEWHTFPSDAHGQRYIDRIEALGYLLSKVSEPRLRLPPFHGIYHDILYEFRTGSRRMGFVFGAPDSLLGDDENLHLFKRDLVQFPPRTLSSLMQDQKTRPPLLGDRFQLAYTLAAAFSLFHAAGWLHKGLHSGNIFFLREEDNTITVTEPFITGFQYSRPQKDESLSQSLFEQQALQHYYHPDADLGFSKRLDLYSLGIVLCEIGRWRLISDTMARDRKKTLVNRGKWSKHIKQTWLEDLGWRMGKGYQDVVRVLLECDLPGSELGDAFFAQEFYKKVLQPLGSRSV
ncbi:hypothetical protein ACJ41O_008911 [Fusarium nematophilum]